VRRFVAQSFASLRYAREGGPVKSEDDPLDPTPVKGTEETNAAIVDNEPAPLREWLPVLAEALGAKPPRHFPKWLARLVAGEAMVMLATDARGASNEKAKRELGWELRYPSWREGFATVYGGSMSSARPPGLMERWPSERSKRTA